MPVHTAQNTELGFGPIYPHHAILRRARMDGRATARHLDGMIERVVHCHTVKVSAESAGAVASNVFFASLTTRQTADKVADSHNLIADGGAGTPAGRGCHLQGIGRHHHRGPLHEGRGLTHALTDIAPTDLTVAAALVRKACSKRRRSRLWSKPVNLRDVRTRVRPHCDGAGLCRAQSSDMA